MGHSHGGRLAFTLQEAQSLSTLLDTEPLLEADATVDSLCAAMSQYRLLHIAAHGEFREDEPLFSSISLDDGALTTLDIFDLHLNASLVTLSACNTGRSVIGGGDELLGLMRAFLYAGASSLVLSQWTVEDRTNAQLMQDFYRKLTAGWTKSSALRYAQRRLLSAATEAAAPTRHPYFWAPMFLVGHRGRL